MSLCSDVRRSFRAFGRGKRPPGEQTKEAGPEDDQRKRNAYKEDPNERNGCDGDVEGASQCSLADPHAGRCDDTDDSRSQPCEHSGNPGDVTVGGVHP